MKNKIKLADMMAGTRVSFKYYSTTAINAWYTERKREEEREREGKGVLERIRFTRHESYSRATRGVIAFDLLLEAKSG